MLTRSEISKHASRESCWVIINGVCYDLTAFLQSHPGGANIILKYAGKDATKIFESIHPRDTIQKFVKPERVLGLVTEQVETPVTTIATPSCKPAENRMKLRSIVNISDFEEAARQRLSPQAFVFFKAGADDENTVQWNKKSWQSIRFRPRVLRPIKNINLSTSLMGTPVSLPFFICPAGGGKMAHPEGEVLLTKAAGKHGALQWVCNMAGCTKKEMSDIRTPGQVLFWQIYPKADLTISEQEVTEAISLGYKGFALTVDAIRASKRERDIRYSLQETEKESMADDDEDDTSTSGGISAQRGSVWSEFDWVSAIKWLRSLTDLPIAIKGIQCWEDAVLCMHHGVHPWLSNHGGRQLDGAPSALDTLLDMRLHCPEVFQKCDVIIDGGITRGTDIVKALALGVKAVGLGRAFLYSLAFGEAGVNKAVRILTHEVETTMALLGVTSIDQLNPSYLKIRQGESML
ncbi:hypothetical protein UA08_05284 [Talaromyces atroroseus]|uniref:Cytochrome b2, mitochondrial n=1 Tax=Talaromyces atroroseus TaxID=1441469 RepID=A0A225AQG6_TALAT|nr:hypothetical protein UA08_05284 [Talaromyces atroroseus]OKL59488.1 hypothetical protein UA08_05284 [Talaromyces atroroseus]